MYCRTSRRAATRRGVSGWSARTRRLSAICLRRFLRLTRPVSRLAFEPPAAPASVALECGDVGGSRPQHRLPPGRQRRAFGQNSARGSDVPFAGSAIRCVDLTPVVSGCPVLEDLRNSRAGPKHRRFRPPLSSALFLPDIGSLLHRQNLADWRGLTYRLAQLTVQSGL